jgi:Fe-Mn family superoxide dismutase
MIKTRFLIDRRDFLTGVGAAATAFAVASRMDSISFAASPPGPDVSLPQLPYAQNALAPVISERTISFHFGKHHHAYANNTIKMISGTEFENAPLVDIIRKTADRPGQTGLFNNAAQLFNHNFYWNSMKPGGGGEPKGKIAEKINESFGDYGKFVEAFSRAAATQFGSGWAWLVEDGGELRVIQTSNADTPITTAAKPLLTIDVWEHAYYLDYQNRRADYIKALVEKLLNWDFAEENLN